MTRLGPDTLVLLGWRTALCPGDVLRPGARELIRSLRETVTPFVVVTDDSARDADEHAAWARDLGLRIDSRSFLVTADTAINWIRVTHPGRPVYVVGTRSLEDRCREVGLRLAGETAAGGREPVVLVGRCPDLDTDRVFGAVDLVLRGAPFAATHAGALHAGAAGAEPDCGAVAAMIATATGREPEVFGKPDPRIVDLALGLYPGTRRDSVLVIGGASDLEMAERAGVASMPAFHATGIEAGDGTPASLIEIRDRLTREPLRPRMRSDLADERSGTEQFIG